MIFLQHVKMGLLSLFDFSKSKNSTCFKQLNKTLQKYVQTTTSFVSANTSGDNNFTMDGNTMTGGDLNVNQSSTVQLASTLVQVVSQIDNSDYSVEAKNEMKNAILEKASPTLSGLGIHNTDNKFDYSTTTVRERNMEQHTVVQQLLNACASNTITINNNTLTNANINIVQKSNNKLKQDLQQTAGQTNDSHTDEKWDNDIVTEIKQAINPMTVCVGIAIILAAVIAVWMLMKKVGAGGSMGRPYMPMRMPMSRPPPMYGPSPPPPMYEPVYGPSPPVPTYEPVPEQYRI